jgi:hypothetical protein
MFGLQMWTSVNLIASGFTEKETSGAVVQSGPKPRNY